MEEKDLRKSMRALLSTLVNCRICSENLEFSTATKKFYTPSIRSYFYKMDICDSHSPDDVLLFLENSFPSAQIPTTYEIEEFPEATAIRVLTKYFDENVFVAHGCKAGSHYPLCYNEKCYCLCHFPS